MTVTRPHGVWHIAKLERTAKGGGAGVTCCSGAHGSLETTQRRTRGESFVETEHTPPQSPEVPRDEH